MTKPRVYVTRRLPGSALDKLEEACCVDLNGEDTAPSKETLIENIRDKDALLCLLTDTIDAEVLAAAPSLKVISNYAVGVDNIDVNAATERGITVTNTPGVLTETTADLAWALLMAVARRIVEADRFTREGKFVGWSPTLFLGGDVHGKTLGIVGLGKIGQAMARRAKGFNMSIVYSDTMRASDAIEGDLGAQFVDLDTLLMQADFVSLHTPLLPETHHLIGERELRKMRPTAFLINSARGPIVDERALVRALKGKWIQGAAVDVFEGEPCLAPGLAGLTNVVLTPHMASASTETRSRMADMAVDNLLAALRGVKPEHVVNHETRQA